MNLITDKVKVDVDTLEELYLTGVLSPDLYYQCLVCLAGDYMKTHDTQAALIMLNRCPPDYFDEPIFNQMKADPKFAMLATELVHRMVRLGVLPDFMERTNQPAAEA